MILPTHTEVWYSKTFPQAGKSLMHRGVEYEVVGLQIDGTSEVIEVKQPAKNS